MADVPFARESTPAANILTFCYSLQKRPVWEPLVNILLYATPKWQVSKLGTHDIAVPVVRSGSPPGQGVFRFILLSQVDLESEQTEKRLERLSNLTGGSNVGVVFLLGDGGSTSGYMQLQLDCMDKFDMPLLPLSSIQALPATLQAFQAQLNTPCLPPRPQQAVLHDLLSCSSLNPHPVEHNLNILSDITHDFKDLADKVATKEGRALLQEYLGADAKNIIDFWMFEYSL